MAIDAWFDEPVVGALPPAKAAERLRALGDIEAATRLEVATTTPEGVDARGLFRAGGWPFQDKPWQHTAHAFGYIAPTLPGQEGDLPVLGVDSVPADDRLKNARLSIVLQRLRIAGYPGGGTHRVLLHFYARNQARGKAEDLHFNATYRVREGEHAGIRGYPIFIGLNVGTEGVMLSCRTINVRNDQDQNFLGFLESDVFKAGLKLTTTIQPAIAPLSGLALAIAKAIGARHQNVAVQDFDLGLDFADIPTGARLAEGAYLAVQVPERQQVWNWENWVYSRSTGQVVRSDTPDQLIPYNYVLFSVNRYEGQ